MIKIIRTDSTNKDFITLVKLLDAYLKIKDGDEHAFYDQYNKVDTIKYVVLVYENGKPVSCGAIKEYSPTEMEVKRMFTLPEQRGKGLAKKVLEELEKWTLELNYKSCLLETGKRQDEAIKLYTKCGYTVIPNYGQYTGLENSVCFGKMLTAID